jgi:hypothetical protein
MDYLEFATDNARAEFRSYPYRVNVTLRNGALIMLTFYATSVQDAVIIAKTRCKANGWDAAVIEVL